MTPPTTIPTLETFEETQRISKEDKSEIAKAYDRAWSKVMNGIFRNKCGGTSGVLEHAHIRDTLARHGIAPPLHKAAHYRALLKPSHGRPAGKRPNTEATQ